MKHRILLNLLQKGVHFTVNIIFAVHNFPSVLIDKKNITSARFHELRFEPRYNAELLSNESYV